VVDEPAVAESLAAKLRPTYEARAVSSAAAALAVDEPVAALVLDRRVPDADAEDIVADVCEDTNDCALVVTTTVDQELNILDAAFDDFPSKPIDRETMVATLDQHIDSEASDPRLDELFETLSDIETLEA
jgi:DNA-binding response OmpR family regulator